MELKSKSVSHCIKTYEKKLLLDVLIFFSLDFKINMFDWLILDFLSSFEFMIIIQLKLCSFNSHSLNKTLTYSTHTIKVIKII